MESLNPHQVLNFFEFVVNLKHVSRRGWDFSKVDNHESVAAHMYSMGMMTFLLGNNTTLDRLKCLQLCIIHDLAESIVGDITPHDNITQEAKHALEDEAMKKITSHVDGEVGTLIYNLYKEYEAKETPEAQFVKDLDKFDLIFTADFYENRDKTPGKLQEYFDIDGQFQHPYIGKLVETLREKRRKRSSNQGEFL